MTNTNLTQLAILLDRSGSMQSIVADTIGGFDAFIAEQRNAPGVCRVTLAQFDNEYEEVYADRPLTSVPGLELHPRGSTALLDAIGQLVTTIGSRLAAMPEHERPGTVIIGIMTDGQENASIEWTHQAIKALIEQQTNHYGWQFLYMGADQAGPVVQRPEFEDPARSLPALHPHQLLYHRPRPFQRDPL